MLSHLLLGDLPVSHMTPVGAISWRLAPGFLWTLLNVLFSFVGFILYAFAVINCSHVVNYVLGPVCCPSESPNLLRLFGTPNIGVCDIQYDI